MRVSVGFVGCLVVGVSMGCQDYYFTPKIPINVTEARILSGAGNPVPADILFVVDNSCSMADEQENLARNFQSFIESVAGDGDYRFAIVTTDVDHPMGEQSGLTRSAFSSSPPYFQTGGIDRTNCTATGIDHSCFRGPDTMMRLVRSDFARDAQVRAFQDNVRVGSCGSGNETGLDAMARALDRSRQGRCNAGFLRDNANLVVVVVSDEDDHGRSTMLGYLAALARHKPMSRVRFAAIIGIDDDGNPSNCRVGANACGSTCSGARPPSGTEAESNFDQYCHSCSFFNAPDCCNAESGGRYVRFARLLEQRIAEADPSIDVTGCRPSSGDRAACIIDSICQAEFADALQRIARDLVSVSEYVLDPPACNPEGVTVQVNGVDLPSEAFSVSDDGVRLAIKGEHVPGPEDKVEIFFVVDGC